MTLNTFLGENRHEIIARCRVKVAKRSAPLTAKAELDHGVPMFLDQLREELDHGPSKTNEIGKSAKMHGHDLLLQEFTISQVVHGYGDVCQSVTDLAVELGAPISTDDFRTMNRCLDDAIAGAVTEFARERDVARDGGTTDLLTLTDTAITAFEVLQSGNVGVGGSTGNVIYRSLKSIREIAGQQHSAVAPRKTESGKA